MKHVARVPTGVGGAGSRIPGMLLMRVTEGAEGDTEIAAPFLRVAVSASTAPGFAGASPARGGKPAPFRVGGGRASTALGFADPSPARAGNAACGVVPPPVAHRCSNVSGFR